jgi:voltage-gated potassium channel
LAIESFKRIFFAIGIILFIIVGGVSGYMIIEDYSFLDALYMTVITISTVGYKEVAELSPKGQVFTIFLIIFSFGVFAYTVSAVTSFVVTGKFKDQLKVFRMKNRVNKLENHVIVCGYGLVGNMACEHLKKHNQEFIIIENDEEKCEELKENEILFVHGNAIEDSALKEARVEKARALISTLPDDAQNLFVVVTARELKSDLQIVSRASVDSTVHKLKIAGANNVIMPDKVGGGQMAAMVTSPDVFVSQISIQGGALVNLEELTFDEFPENLQGKSLAELDIRKKFGVNVVGLKTAEGEFVLNPGPEDKFTQDTKLFVLGKPDQISNLNKELGIEH